MFSLFWCLWQFRGVLVYCRISLFCNCSDVYLMLILQCGFLVKCPQRKSASLITSYQGAPTISTNYHAGINLDYLAEVVGVCQISSVVKLLYPLCFIHYSLEGSLYAKSLLKESELCFTSLRAEHLHKLLGILLHRRFVFSPQFIYVLNHENELMEIYPLDFNPILYFIVQMIPALTIRSSFTCLLDMPHQQGFVFVCF